MSLGVFPCVVSELNWGCRGLTRGLFGGRMGRGAGCLPLGPVFLRRGGLLRLLARRNGVLCLPDGLFDHSGCLTVVPLGWAVGPGFWVLGWVLPW